MKAPQLKERMKQKAANKSKTDLRTSDNASEAVTAIGSRLHGDPHAVFKIQIQNAPFFLFLDVQCLHRCGFCTGFVWFEFGYR